MAKIDFGGVVEDVVTREEFPLEKAREVLKNEVVAVLGYGVQGPAQALGNVKGPKIGIKLSPTVGFPARRSSLSKKRLNVARSSSTCSRTPVSARNGRRSSSA